MSIANLPESLQGAIQENLLYTEFEQALQPNLVYRTIAQREKFDIQKGQTMTYTRAGLKPPVTTALNPQQNTNLDNGLTPKSIPVEQYTMALNQYGDTLDLDIMTSQVMIANLAMQYTKTNGQQSSSSLDGLAKTQLFNGYMGGNTRVTATLGAPGVTIEVDDIRGFDKVLNAKGQIVPVDGSNPLSVVVDDNTYDLISSAADVVNTSTTRYIYDADGNIIYGTGGISGTLTFSSNVTVNDGTTGKAVVSAYAPAIFRPNARATTAALTSGDLLTMELFLDVISYLESNNVPTMPDGFYHCFLDNKSSKQLFSDPEFQLLYRGRGMNDPVYRKAKIFEGLNVRFFVTTQAPQQLQSATTGALVRRPIVCGADVLVEGTFAGQVEVLNSAMKGNGHFDVVEDIVHIVRPPIDRLQQIVAMSWSWTGGYALPSDATANRTVINTASNAYLKRAVILETA
jgi:hypothetical protein